MSTIAPSPLSSYHRQELVEALTSGRQFSAPLLLTLDNCTIEILCSTEALRTTLQGYFSSLLQGEHGACRIRIIAIDGTPPTFSGALTPRKPKPGRSEVKEEWGALAGGRLVRKTTTGMVMIFGEDDNLVIGPCEKKPNQLINFINNRFIAYKLAQGVVLGQAAAVSCNDIGLAIAGFSPVHRSTLALDLMNCGADFISNNKLLLEQTTDHPKMTGIAKWPRIKPGTALHNPSLRGVLPREKKQQYQSLAPAELWQLNQKYDVPVEDYFGPDRYRLHSSLDRLVMVTCQAEQEPLVAREIKLEQRQELLPIFMRDSGLFYLPPEDHPQNPPEERYLELLHGCPVLELSGGMRYQEACGIIQEWLQ